jgi:anti-sigma factor RsiW
MKTFEEKLTAWLDGQLQGEELRVFEKEYPSAQQEKADYLKLKTLLKENFCCRDLDNPEFFNSQIMEKIERMTGERNRSPRRALLVLPRLAWGGICALGVGVALFFAVIPRGGLSDPGAGYVAEVLKTRTADPKVKATVENRKDMTIIKLEGLDKVPPGKDLNH